MFMRVCFAAALIFCMSAMGQERSLNPIFLELLVDPSKFDGRRVRVFGYCRISPDRAGIFLHKEDYMHGLGNMVWLELDAKEMTAEKKKIEYCSVGGTFNAKNRGYLGMYRGAIENITIYEPWPPRPVTPRKGR